MSEKRPGQNPIKTRLLYAELVNTLRERLRPVVKALFDAVDDSLFDLTEHSQGGARQQAYFDGMRECRKHRDAAIERLFAAIGEDLPPQPDRAVGQDDLSLLSHEELEIHLAVTGMAGRAGQQLAPVLHALTASLGVLNEWDDPEDEDNPLGPGRLSAAFRDAIAPLDLALEVRLILFKLFERHVLTALEPVYRQLVDELAKAGIVPPERPARSPSPPATPARTRPEPGAERPETAPANKARKEAGSATPAAEEQALLDLLLDLVALRQERPATAQPARGAAARRSQEAAPQSPAVPASLLKAIERSARRVAEGGRLPPPRQFAAQLLAEARYAGDSAETQPAKAATVDLVGRLFDAMLQDQQVSRPMQPVLHRMQVPVTRVALEDPRCLSDPMNPIRQALDLLGETSLGWCRGADPEGRLLEELRESVDTIAAAPNVEELSRQLEELNRLLEKQQRRAELAEQRTVEAATGRERLTHARRKVHQILSAKLAKTPIPAWVRHLLVRPWANYLVLLWLRNGEDSAPFGEALEFVDSLMWCAGSGRNKVEKLRLRAMLPVLEGQLRTGLATVAYHDSEIVQLVDELREFVRYRLGETPEPHFLEHEPHVSGHLHPPGDPEIDEEQPRPEDIDPALLERLAEARPGTWFEFGPRGSEEFERAKLSWVSPYSGRYLFVNRNGMRVADRRPQELVQELEQDLARILESAKLLQRALGRVLEQVRGGLPPAGKGRQQAG